MIPDSYVSRFGKTTGASRDDVAHGFTTIPDRSYKDNMTPKPNLPNREELVVIASSPNCDGVSCFARRVAGHPDAEQAAIATRDGTAAIQTRGGRALTLDVKFTALTRYMARTRKL